MCLIQRGGIGDPLAPLFARKRINDQMGGTDQASFHGRRRLDGEERIHESLIDATAKLGQGCGQHKVRLGELSLVLAQATGIHDSKVGAQTLADILIGSAQFMLE